MTMKNSDDAIKSTRAAGVLAMAAALSTGPVRHAHVHGPDCNHGDAERVILVPTSPNRGKAPMTAEEIQARAMQARAMQARASAMAAQQAFERADAAADASRRAKVEKAAVQAAVDKRARRKARNLRIVAAGGMGMVKVLENSQTITMLGQTSAPMKVGEVMQSALILTTPLPKAPPLVTEEAIAAPPEAPAHETIVITPSNGQPVSVSEVELQEARTVMWILAKLPKAARPAGFKAATDKTHTHRKNMKLPKGWCPTAADIAALGVVGTDHFDRLGVK